MTPVVTQINQNRDIGKSIPPNTLGEPAEASTNSAPSSEELRQAFDAFNAMSEQLSSSYQILETRVSSLTEELNSVSAIRLEELAEKEQLADRLEGLLNVLPGGVIVLDSKGVVTQANPAAYEMLGEPLEGQLWRDVIKRSFSPRDDDGHEVSTHDGRRISIATRSLAEDGQIILLTDNTETRRLQGELSRHERLSALGRMVSALAHQIRTPLSAAMLYAGHLTEGKLSGEQQSQFSLKLLNRLNHMERQVQDMLVFVKGELPLTDTLCVRELEIIIKEESEAVIGEHKATCRWHNSCPTQRLKCHRDSIVGAVMNLINNAIQAQPGQPVQIHIDFELEDDHLIIAVEDNGPGMSPELVKSVKEAFVTTKSQGTGLGLAVVDNVARRHSGEFTLESELNEGVIATIRLPLIPSINPLEI